MNLESIPTWRRRVRKNISKKSLFALKVAISGPHEVDLQQLWYSIIKSYVTKMLKASIIDPLQGNMD